ncbi:hypothetical protein DSECCO2_389450 [anaerobic digester metagenome]
MIICAVRYIDKGICALHRFFRPLGVNGRAFGQGHAGDLGGQRRIGIPACEVIAVTGWFVAAQVNHRAGSLGYAGNCRAAVCLKGQGIIGAGGTAAAGTAAAAAIVIVVRACFFQR